jgi:hypothetical protein
VPYLLGQLIGQQRVIRTVTQALLEAIGNFPDMRRQARE